MTKDQIIQTTNAIIAEHFEIDAAMIEPDAIIRQTLDLDSVRAMELVIIAKKQFGVIIPPRQLPRMVTFDDLYDYLNEHQS